MTARHDDADGGAGPAVSIIVPLTPETPSAVEHLEALVERTRSIRFELLVVPTGGRRRDAQLAHRVPAARILERHTGRGFSDACEAALASARAGLVAFLHDDVEVHERWLDELMAAMEDPRIGLAGPLVLDPSGRVESAGRVVWRDGTFTDVGAGLDADHHEIGYRRAVDCVPSAASLVRREALERAGGFRLSYAPAHIDAAMCFDVRALGLDAVLAPAARVTHHGGGGHFPDLALEPDPETGRDAFQNAYATSLAGHEERGRRLFRARDRSRDRAHVLVVDRHVPERDRDAGGRSVFTYLRLLAELGLRVTLLPADGVRRAPYAAELEALGIEVLGGDGFDISSWLRRFGPYLTAVWLHRPEVATRLQAALREHAPQATLVYVPHDLHHLREQRRFETTGDVGALEAAALLEAEERRALAGADRVHVFSDHEVGLVREATRAPVRWIPLFVPDDEPPAPAGLTIRAGLLFVGGFDHEPNRDGVLWFVEEVLPLLGGEAAHATLTVVGARPPREVRARAGERVVVTGPVPEEDLRALYAQARVVVAPLRFGAGLKGKVVEALAAGVPVVTTPVGAEGLPGGDAPLVVAGSAEDFAARLTELYTDEPRWERLARDGAAYAAAHFTRAAAADRVLADLLAGEVRPGPGRQSPAASPITRS